MRIGELAGKAGITPDTIRYYEREGLLPRAPRTPGGYRDYGPEALDDLQFIKKAQLSGLKLGDVREILEISSGGKAPCEHVRATVTARLAEVDGRLRDLEALRAALRATLERLQREPQPSGRCRCAAIETL